MTDIDENEGDVRLDGDKPQDESCKLLIFVMMIVR